MMMRWLLALVIAAGTPLATAAADTSKVTLQASIKKDHSGFLKKVSMSPDGKLVAFLVQGEKTIDVRSAVDGNVVATIVHDEVPQALEDFVISSDSKYLASLVLDGNIRIWEISSTPKLVHHRLQNDDPKQISFSPDGQWLAIGGYKGDISLWNPQTDAVRSIRKGTGSNALDPVFGLSFSPDGKSLIWADGSQVIHQYDLSSSQERTASLVSLEVENWIASPDGKWIAVPGYSFRLWNFSSGKVAGEIDRPSVHRFGHAVFLGDGKRIVVSVLDKIEIWNIADIVAGNRAAIPAAVFDRSAENLVAVSQDGRVLAAEVLFESKYEIWRLNISD